MSILQAGNIILLHGGKDCTKEFLEVHSEDGSRIRSKRVLVE